MPCGISRVSTNSELAGWMSRHQARIESVLEEMLESASVAPSRLHEAMRYAALGGGKRVRPLLAYAAGEASGALPERVDRVAAAVECIHAYSLVHDDLPCMDDDVLRRGRATVHVAFDEATALLVGDSLQSLAFACLSGAALADDPLAQVEMVATLARAAGSRGMAGGQAVDLDSEGRALTVAELEFMHVHKTGALIAAAVDLGAACGRCSPAEREAMGRFAGRIGLAFQVVDDVLDATQPTETLGKTAGKDAAHGKATYVTILGLERARRLAGELLDDALAALAVLGERGTRLAQLGRFIVTRSS